MTPPTAQSVAPSSTIGTPLSSSKSSLNKVVITKKKLEFAAHKHIEEEESKNDSTDYESLGMESLKALVEEKKSKLLILERYKAEKAELTELTQRWKEAGLAGLERLSKHIQPERTVEELLDNFKIPQEMFL